MIKKILQNNHQQEIILKALSSLLIRGLGYIFGFLFIWLIAKKLGPSTQGVFSISFLFLSVGSMISKVGFSTGLVKWIANEKSKLKQIEIIQKSFLTVIVSSIIIATVIYFSSTLIAFYYNKPEVILSIKIAAICIPIFSLLEVGSAVFKGVKATSTFSLYFDLLKFVFPVVVFVVSYFFFKKIFIELPIISYLIGHSILLIILLIHLLIKFKNQTLENEKLQKENNLKISLMLQESLPMLMASSIVMLMGWSDIFVLGFYVDEEKIGIYSTAVRLAALVSFIYTAVAAIMTPKIAEMHRYKRSKDFRDTIAFSSKVMFLCSLPIFFILFIFSSFFLNIFGEEYIAGETVLRILLIAQLANVITGPVGPIFQMTGGQKKLQQFLFISLVINFVLSFALVNSFELEGVAIASAIGMISWNFLGSVYLKKERNIKTWMKF